MKKRMIRLSAVFFTMLICLYSGCVQMNPDESNKSIQEGETRLSEGGSPASAGMEKPASQDAEYIGEIELPMFEEPHVSLYAYDTLSAAEQLWYQDINMTLGNMLVEKELAKEGFEAGLDVTDIEKVFQCVLNDHPEYFFVEGYTYTKYTQLDKMIRIEFSGTYNVSKEEAVKRYEQIQLSVEQLLAMLPADAADYQKVKYVYETIIRNTEYDLSAPDNQNIYSVFVGHASVCQGYAKATQYLLNRLAIPCTLVLGEVNSGAGHAWNLVMIENKYYYVDTTWGDASYQTDGVSAFAMPEINYDYLCVTTGQILKTHTISEMVPMPECNDMDWNYYVIEGAYFTSFDEDQMKTVFTNAKAQGKSDVTLKCAGEDIYEEMARRLLNEKEIFLYLEQEGGQIAYTQNEEELSLTFWVTNE